MADNFDLFGDPVPDGWGRRGRPPHLATQQNRNKVSMLLAMGWNNDRIARALHVTLPTLRKHYFAELKFREEARDRLDARLALQLWGQVEAGNVGAIKEFGRLLERNDLMNYGQKRGPAVERPAAVLKLGKKETARLAAATPDTGSKLGELIARRQGQTLQ